MKKTLLCLLTLMLIVVCVCAFSLQSNATTVDNGTCGENLTWTLDDAGTLTISGTGEMYDYDWENAAPWYDDCDSIKNVIIEPGVTTIGDYAFAYCTSLTSVDIPNGVTIIDDYTFFVCTSLTLLTIRDSVTIIGNKAFLWCLSLTDVYYTGTEEQWNEIEIGEENAPLLEATLHFETADNTVTPGELDGNEAVNEDNVIYLLQHLLMPEEFPL